MPDGGKRLRRFLSAERAIQSRPRVSSLRESYPAGVRVSRTYWPGDHQGAVTSRCENGARSLAHEARQTASIAPRDDTGSGLTPVTQGWFVVNVRDAEWWSSEGRGARCAFESEYGEPPVEFAQVGINVTVLEPRRRWTDDSLPRTPSRTMREALPRRSVRGVCPTQTDRRGRGATPAALGLLPLASLDRARLRGRGRRAVCDPDASVSMLAAR